MKRFVSIAASAALALLAGQAMAAEVDMSRLTCKEVGAMSAAQAVAVAMWMNGYVHGKAGNPKVDGDKAEANAAKIAGYCKKNSHATLASALQAVAAK